MPWRDQLSLQCPLCEAAFRASSMPLLRRILDEHTVKVHDLAPQDILRALDPLPDGQRLSSPAHRLGPRD